MKNRAASWTAWALVAAAAPMCVATSVFGVMRSSHGDGVNEFVGEAIQYLTQWSFGVVGAVIVSRRSANPVGWMFCALSLSTVLGSFTYEYGFYALVTEPGSLPAGAEMAWLGRWVWAPSIGLLGLVLLYFPDGTLPSRRWAGVAWLAGGATVLMVVAGLSAWPMRGPTLVEDVPGLRGAIIDNLGIPLAFMAVLASAISLIVRFRAAQGELRRQLLWLAYAAGLTFTAVVGNTLLSAVGAPGWILSVIFGLAFTAVPVAAAIAILKYRLYDIDVIVNRTLVYGALTACVVGIYVVVVGYLGVMFRAQGNIAISLLATGVVAVLFAPLRDRLQRIVERLMYGERDDPYRVVSRLGARLGDALDLDSVLPTVARTVREAMKLPYAAVELRDGDARAVAAADGSPTASTERISLSHRGEDIGALLLAPRAGESGFSSADRRLLNDLARQAGAAAYAVRLTKDLQRSREELVASREEERRRLRRDLHDGLPCLSG